MLDILARHRRQTFLLRLGFGSCFCAVLFLFTTPFLLEQPQPRSMPTFTPIAQRVTATAATAARMGGREVLVQR